MKKLVLVFATAGILASGSAIAQKQPSPEQSYLMKMDFAPISCSMDAGMARRSGYANDNQKAAECVGRELKAGKERFEVMMKHTKKKAIKDALKDMYVKWMTYMNSISPYDPPSERARERYEDAANRWRVELETK